MSENDTSKFARQAIKDAIFDKGWIIGTVEGIDEQVFYGMADEYALTTLLTEMVAAGELQLHGAHYRLTPTEYDAVKRKRLFDFLKESDYGDDLELVHELTKPRR